jgi:hypothetical protein
MRDKGPLTARIGNAKRLPYILITHTKRRYDDDDDGTKIYLL